MEDTIYSTISALGFKALTPIQLEVLDTYKSFDELVLYAPTGSGKTLAFLFPLLELLRANSNQSSPKALIVSPTRELAQQIETVFKSLKSGFEVSTCYGGHSRLVELRNLSANPDIVVGTPGRLLDHIASGALQISNLSFFIVDEFDKCLEMGFQDQIEAIYKETSQLKKLFFASATKLNEFPTFIPLKNPKIIDKTSLDVQPVFDFFKLKSQENKLQVIKNLVSQYSKERVIIFCNFREDVDALEQFFNHYRIVSVAYHGGLDQEVRERALIKFRNNSAPVLVCTDVGSRGLDIPEVKHIVHFTLPEKLEAFVHRNGRTARMMEQGSVYFFDSDVKETKYELPRATIFKGHDNPIYEAPSWTTLYFSGGKKNKINKIDLLGFICKQGGLAQDEVGVIAVLDFTSFVAVRAQKVKNLLLELHKHKIKGQKLKVAVAY